MDETQIRSSLTDRNGLGSCHQENDTSMRLPGWQVVVRVYIQLDHTSASWKEENRRISPLSTQRLEARTQEDGLHGGAERHVYKVEICGWGEETVRT